MKALRPLVVAGACVALYMALYAAKRQLAPADNTLAECFAVFLATLPIALAALLALGRKRYLSLEGTVSALAIFLLATACFFLSVPAIVNRSATLYLINILDSHEQGMTVEEVHEEFIHVYFSESQGIQRRLNEQLDSGRLAYADGRYYITGSGRRTLWLARALSRLYAMDPSIVERRPPDDG